MKDRIEIFVVILIIIIFVFTFILAISQIHGSYKCSNYASVTGTKTKWVTMDACYLETENGWQRYDEYKNRSIGKDSLRFDFDD